MTGKIFSCPRPTSPIIHVELPPGGIPEGWEIDPKTGKPYKKVTDDDNEKVILFVIGAIIVVWLLF